MSALIMNFGLSAGYSVPSPGASLGTADQLSLTFLLGIGGLGINLNMPVQ